MPARFTFCYRYELRRKDLFPLQCSHKTLTPDSCSSTLPIYTPSLSFLALLLLELCVCEFIKTVTALRETCGADPVISLSVKSHFLLKLRCGGGGGAEHAVPALRCQGRAEAQPDGPAQPCGEGQGDRRQGRLSGQPGLSHQRRAQVALLTREEALGTGPYRRP